jgi:hypothetical protein
VGKIVSTKINCKDIRELCYYLLSVKSIEYGVNLSKSHINLILDFYFYGISISTYNKHLEMSVNNKNYFKSKPAIDNAKSYLKKNNVLIMNKELEVNSDFLPPLQKENKINVNISIIYDN